MIGYISTYGLLSQLGELLGQGTMDVNPKIPIRYELNAPEELAGKSGSLTIKFFITENAACNEFFYDN